MSDYLSVSTLTKYLKLKFDRDSIFGANLFDRSGFQFSSSPNASIFFFKRRNAVIQATMWQELLKNLVLSLKKA